MSLIMYRIYMIQTTFKANGTNYQLITVGISRHEREAIAANIGPDPNLWKTPRSKRGMGVLREEKFKRPQERYVRAVPSLAEFEE